jgi:hypothetical protein
MTTRFRWHRTMTIALAVAFIAATLVHEREVSLLTTADAHRLPLGWLAVFGAAVLCFVCGASSRSTPNGADERRLEDAPD